MNCSKCASPLYFECLRDGLVCVVCSNRHGDCGGCQGHITTEEYVKIVKTVNRALKPKQRVEINFNVPRGEKITFKLDKEKSGQLLEYLREGLTPQVFFPDYEE